MVGAERGADGGQRDARRLAIVADERHHFVDDVFVVLVLHPAAMKRVGGTIAERIAMIDVHAVQFHPPGLDRTGQRLEHPLSFELPFVAAGRRKHDGRWPPVAADQHAHFTSETTRVPPVISAAHAATV